MCARNVSTVRRRQSEGSGVFQADDVKCKSGQGDYRLTKDFKVFAITMD